VGIKTDSAFTKARIESIDTDVMTNDLDAGRVIVVAGFQGFDANGNTTTLGRGGSDTSGVAIAAALKADECQIYTDVDGVYTTDPRVAPKAKKIDRISFEEMLEMASLGSKVLQIRSVEFAGKYQVPLRVLSSFDNDDDGAFDDEFKENVGTLITTEAEDTMEQPIIAGIAFNRDEAKLTILGVPDEPGIASKILSPVSDANIEVDMIVQNVEEDGTTDFTFTVNRVDLAKAEKILNETAKNIGARE
ncbi:aspartate kinase, partial [Acinetobacter baumannii]|nr:aspartate kinase [Acinetobacter baumannii]